MSATNCFVEHQGLSIMFLFRSYRPVPRVDQSKLRQIALRIIDDALADAECDVVAQTLGIRLALVYLASIAEGDREPFLEFWHSLKCRDDFSRQVRLKRAQIKILFALGLLDARQMAAHLVALPVEGKKGWIGKRSIR